MSQDSDINKVQNDPKYGKLMIALEVARQILNDMKPGQRTNFKQLNKAVAEKTSLSPTQVQPFVIMAVQTYDGLTVTRGRYGGIIKGLKEKKNDERERCTHCKQVIRKGKKRSKKDGILGGTDLVSTDSEPTEEPLESTVSLTHSESDDESVEDLDDEFDEDDDEDEEED